MKISTLQDHLEAHGLARHLMPIQRTADRFRRMAGDLDRFNDECTRLSRTLEGAFQTTGMDMVAEFADSPAVRAAEELGHKADEIARILERVARSVPAPFADTDPAPVIPRPAPAVHIHITIIHKDTDA